MRTTTFPLGDFLPESARLFMRRRFQELVGIAIIAATVALGASLATWSINDPSLNHATDAKVHNVLGVNGAIVADLVMQLVGVSSIALLAPLGFFGWRVAIHQPTGERKLRSGYWLLGIISSAALASLLPNTERWPLPTGMGGVIGDAVLSLPRLYFSNAGLALTALVLGVTAIFSLSIAAGFGHLPQREKQAARAKCAAGCGLTRSRARAVAGRTHASGSLETRGSDRSPRTGRRLQPRSGDERAKEPEAEAFSGLAEIAWPERAPFAP